MNEISVRAFAKVDIPAGTTITLYSGLHLSKTELEKFNEEATANFSGPKEDQWMTTKYHGSVAECGFSITIPYQDGPLSKYRAALGHKLNHRYLF